MNTRTLPVVLVLCLLLLAGCNGGTNPSLNDTDGQNNTVNDSTPAGTQTEETSSPTHSTKTRPTPQTFTPTEPQTETNTDTDTDTNTGTDTDTGNETPTVTGTPNSNSNGGTPTPTTDTGPDRENPWEEKTLTVAIEDKTNSNRSFTPLVQDALAYWEQNAEQYAGYQIDYRLKQNATNPDIVISFVPKIKQCGRDTNVEGCAPYIRSPEDVDRPVTVKVHGGYDKKSTLHLISHELGHTLGLGHDDEPSGVMAAETDLTTLPRPNVSERALPWNHETLTVGVDLSNVSPANRSAVNKQINAALRYYDRGANGTIPKRVSFRRINNPEKADITIQFPEDSPCSGLDSGSCSIASGYNPDDDDATEIYSHVDIMLTDVDTSSVAWHVGNRLGEDAFGFDEPRDYPKPLRSNASRAVRHSRWWRGEGT